MKRKKDFIITEEYEDEYDTEHKQIPIVSRKLQDAFEDTKDSKLGRYIADPITVNGKILDYNGLDEEEIEFKVSATRDNWEKLYGLGISDPEKLGRGIFLNFAEPLIENLNRDKDRDLRSAFMRNSRQYTAAVYVPALYWLKLPSDKWPIFFKDLLKQFDDSKIINPKKGLPVASRIAHQCWKKQFEEQRKKLGFDDKQTREDFQETYLDKNRYIEPAKNYFEKNDYKPTIENLFDFLKGIP